MSGWLNSILGLDALRFGEEGVAFGFAHALPAYVWALALALALAIAVWCYWRVPGRRDARAALAGVRWLVLALVLFLAAGPQLSRTNERVERDWVAVLVDRSASLGVGDGPEGTTREAQLRSALEAARAPLAQLAEEHTLLWLGFDAGVYDLDPAAMPEPTGLSTRVDAALDRTLARLAAKPISAIVLITDGRSARAPDRGLIRDLRAQRVPVLGVPLGSAEPVGDWQVARVEAPGVAFLKDVVPVRVDLARRGGAGGARVELIETSTGLVLDSAEVPAGEAPTVTLRHRVGESGQARWQVRVVPTGRDLIASNNTREVALSFIDRPLRIAYFDGYPRWEQRYVKNLLLREDSIESATLLLATDRAYLQEGEITLDALPRSPEDWARFDVVVIGDVGPEVFSGEQLEHLREHVAVRGAGLLWIGGPGATPVAWAGTPLGDLLPFSEPERVGALAMPVTMARAPTAERLGLLALGEPGGPDAGEWPERLADPASGFSLFRYAQRVDRRTVKPGAEVLATFETGSDESSPAVLSMRFGAGQVVYVATDETWRWRYALGEALQERFWLPLLRHLGRASAARAGRGFELTVSPEDAAPGQPVRVALELLDQALIDTAPQRMAVRVQRGDGAPITLELAREAGAGAIYSATWTAPEAGAYRFRPEGLGVLEGEEGSTDLAVRVPDDELRSPDADHALLAALAEETGGRVVPADELWRLPELTPNRERRTEAPPEIRTLWDTPLALALLLTLLVVEWVGRRLIRLV